MSDACRDCPLCTPGGDAYVEALRKLNPTPLTQDALRRACSCDPANGGSGVCMNVMCAPKITC